MNTNPWKIPRAIMQEEIDSLLLSYAADHPEKVQGLIFALVQRLSYRLSFDEIRDWLIDLREAYRKDVTEQLAAEAKEEVIA